MDNRTKQDMAVLEARIMRLERIIGDINCAIMIHDQPILACNQCGYNDPIRSGVICNQVDCCIGLNPDDDNNQQ